MGTVTISTKEYYLLRKHNDKFVKMMNENTELKNSSKVIIRTVKRPTVVSVMRGVFRRRRYFRGICQL